MDDAEQFSDAVLSSEEGDAVAVADEPSKGRTTQSARAGLLFPVAKVDKHLRKLDIADRYNKSASIFMAGVLEYLAEETLVIAWIELQNFGRGRKRIIPKDIQYAVKHDSDLCPLWKSLGVITPEEAGKIRTKSVGNKHWLVNLFPKEYPKQYHNLYCANFAKCKLCGTMYRFRSKAKYCYRKCREAQPISKKSCKKSPKRSWIV